MHLPGLQFVKRMGVVTEKAHVMVQPTVLVMREAPETKRTCPATIVDKINVGWLVKYFLVFDDDVVSLTLILCDYLCLEAKCGTRIRRVRQTVRRC